MIDKFERVEEPKKNHDSTESILFSLVFFFLIVLGGLWYYQNQNMTESDYVRKNEIKLLEQRQESLEGEIDRVLEENSRLKKERNTASILSQ